MEQRHEGGFNNIHVSDGFSGDGRRRLSGVDSPEMAGCHTPLNKAFHLLPLPSRPFPPLAGPHARFKAHTYVSSIATHQRVPEVIDGDKAPVQALFHRHPDKTLAVLEHDSLTVGMAAPHEHLTGDIKRGMLPGLGPGLDEQGCVCKY